MKNCVDNGRQTKCLKNANDLDANDYDGRSNKGALATKQWLH